MNTKQHTSHTCGLLSLCVSVCKFSSLSVGNVSLQLSHIIVPSLLFSLKWSGSSSPPTMSLLLSLSSLSVSFGGVSLGAASGDSLDATYSVSLSASGGSFVSAVSSVSLGAAGSVSNGAAGSVSLDVAGSVSLGAASTASLGRAGSVSLGA